MENRLKIMLALSLIGIFTLMLLSNIIPPKISSISEINNESVNQRIKIIAEITNIKEYNNRTFQVLTIEQGNASIKGISNSRNSLIPLIEESKNYSIIGIIEKYNQTLQINIQEIKSG